MGTQLRVDECQCTMEEYSRHPSVQTVERHARARFLLVAYLLHGGKKVDDCDPYKFADETRQFVHYHGLQMSLSYAEDLCMIISECKDVSRKACQEWVDEAILILETNRCFTSLSISDSKRLEHVKKLKT